jgi:hypothetical protein
MLRCSERQWVLLSVYINTVPGFITDKLFKVQLPTYNWTKSQLVSRNILPADSIWTYLASSSVSGVCVVSGALPCLMTVNNKIS